MHKKRLYQLLFAAYGILMLWLLFGQRIGGDTAGSYLERLRESYNLIPFYTIGELTVNLMTYRGGLRLHAFVNLLGNVVMFVPLGVLLPGIRERFRSWKWLMLTAVLMLLCVELIQLFSLLGSFDIDDLILNLLGVWIGYGVFRYAARRGFL